MKTSSEIQKDFSDPELSENEPKPHGERTIPTTCVETVGGDPETALRLSFQIKVF